MRIGLRTCEPGPGSRMARRSDGSGSVIPPMVGVGAAAVGSTMMAGVTCESTARVGVPIGRSRGVGEGGVSSVAGAAGGGGGGGAGGVEGGGGRGRAGKGGKG